MGEVVEGGGGDVRWGRGEVNGLRLVGWVGSCKSFQEDRLVTK